jgi:protein-arginine kinase activator protein McsA
LKTTKQMVKGEVKILEIVAEIMEEHLDEEHQEETKQDIEPAICENCKDTILEEMVTDEKLCYPCYKEKIYTPRNDAMESEEIETAKGEALKLTFK